MTSRIEPVTAYVGLGSNLNDPERQIRSALEELASLPGTRVSRASSLYRSAPVGHADQPPFVNGVAELSTHLSARALLEGLLGIEARHGRVRSFPNAPRPLDLDLLLYGESTVDEPDLHVPHPRMHERRFVLLPLCEIAPQCAIPGRGLVSDWLATTAQQQVEPIGPVR